jgi:AcrR family transcriptional regulator
VSASRDLERRRQPVQERSRETVTAIIEAAAQVFERYGYAAGTTNRIAARAGVSVGSLYQYFPNKEAILLSLTERHMDDGQRRLAPLARAFATKPPPLQEGLERLVTTIVELHADSPRLHRVLFEECPRPPALQERITAAQALAVDVIASWLSARAEVSATDTKLAAEMVVQVVEGVAHGLVIHPQPNREPRAYVAETVKMLYCYLLAERPAAAPRKARALLGREAAEQR